MTVTSGRHARKDKERQQRMEGNIRARFAASSRLQNRHRWPRACNSPEPGSKAWSFCRQGYTAGGAIPHECARRWRPPRGGRRGAYPVRCDISYLSTFSCARWESTKFIAKVSLVGRAFGWVLFTAAPAGGRFLYRGFKFVWLFLAHRVCAAVLVCQYEI